MTLENSLAAVVEAFRNTQLTQVELSVTKQFPPVDPKTKKQPPGFELAINTVWTSQAGGGEDGIPPTTLKATGRGKTLQECVAMIKGTATANAQVAVNVGSALG